LAKQLFFIRNIFLIILFTLPFLGIAQQASDSLQAFSYNELSKKFEQHPENQKKYANVYLNRAKKEKDSLHIIEGYKLKIRVNSFENHVYYFDSIIAISTKIKNYENSSLAYLSKGIIIRRTNKNFKKALDYFLIALSNAERINSQKNINVIQWNIALLKDRIGDYQEALKIEKEIFKNENTLSSEFYINLISLLSTTYRNLNVLDSSSYYNKLGLQQTIKTNNKIMYPFFLLNEALVDYENMRYQNAFDSIAKSIPLLEETKNLPNLAIACNYLGKLHLKKKKEKLAIINFKKTDSIFNILNDLHPEARSAYEDLINYYKKEKNTEQQLKYVNQLLKLDSILSSNSIYISKRITKEYDIPKLEAEKDTLLQEFNKSKKSYTSIIIILSIAILLVLFGLYYQFKKRQLYKSRFEKLVTEKTPSPSILDTKKSLPKAIKEKKGISVPESIIESILKQLLVFEEEKGFTTLGLTSQILAKKFKTNTKYLSMVVNHFKEQSFINYLNNLRIDYAVERLKTDMVFRRYTVQAISKEVGFNNTESFSKSFYKKTGIKPSFFVKELNKQEKNS